MFLWCKWNWLICFQWNILIWRLKLKYKNSQSNFGTQAVEAQSSKNWIVSQSQQVFTLAKWRREVQNRQRAAQSPRPISGSDARRRCVFASKCVGGKRIRGLKQLFSQRTPCLLSAAWHSKRSLLSLSPDTLRLANNTVDMCKSQNTVPLKPFGCWQGPRRWLTCAALGSMAGF